MAIGSWLGKGPGEKYTNDKEILCGKCGKKNTPSNNDRKTGKMFCKRCGNKLIVLQE